MIVLKIVEIFFFILSKESVKDIKFTIMENYEEDILTITNEYMKFKPQFYGLNKKSKLS